MSTIYRAIPTNTKLSTRLVEAATSATSCHLTSTKTSQGFTNFTHRLTEEQKLKLQRTIDELEKKQHFAESYKTILAAAKENSWAKKENASLLAMEDFDYFLLIALKKDDLSIEQLTTCQMVKSALSETPNPSKTKEVDLFLPNGEINPEARKLIEATNTNLTNQRSIATKQQIDLFFQSMKTKPKAEQRLYLVKDKSWEDARQYAIQTAQAPFTGKAADRDLLTVSQIVKVQAGFNLFGSDLMKGMMLVPSFSMMQTIVSVCGQENAIEMRPTMGSTTDRDIHQDLPKGRRDFAVPMKGFALPKTADYTKTSSYEFIFHDFYHAFTLSHIPPKHREAYYEMGCDILELIEQEKDPDLIEQYQWAFETVIDLDLILYRPDMQADTIPGPQLFWHAMQTFQVFITIHRPELERRTNINSYAEKFNDSQFWQKLAQKLKPRMEKWIQSYGLTTTSLRQAWSSIESNMRQTYASMSNQQTGILEQALRLQPLYILQTELC